MDVPLIEDKTMLNEEQKEMFNKVAGCATTLRCLLEDFYSELRLNGKCDADDSLAEDIYDISVEVSVIEEYFDNYVANNSDN